ncbi:MAG: aspartate aminotransferase family protein [Candidatus Omnitrophota bacterium]|jgi:acetylornithine/N-succinyldiaminopimelate aminotransferase
MKVQELFNTYKDYIMPTYTKTPLAFVKGKGSYLWDVHNRKYLDFFPGWGVGNLGHCHPKVMNAIRDQISKLLFIPNNYYHIPQARLAKEFNFYSGFPVKIFYCNSGAEANEAAIKFARKFGKGRFQIITFLNSFHGRTLATLAATGQDKYKQGFAPLPEGFITVAFNNLKAVESSLTDQTVAVMLELIQGEGGINIADVEFVRGLRKLCDKNKLLLIIDEVQTGMGRTGKMFAYQHYGIIPDVVTLAKSLGGGLPIGAMLVKREIADVLGPGTHASTFGGGPVICRAALAVLKAIQKEKLLSKVTISGEYLLTQLNSLKNKYPIIADVRGKGLMVAVELKSEGREVVEQCLSKGLLINCTHQKVLRLMPALMITKKEINQAICILDQVFQTLANR